VDRIGGPAATSVSLCVPLRLRDRPGLSRSRQATQYTPLFWAVAPPQTPRVVDPFAAAASGRRQYRLRDSAGRRSLSCVGLRTAPHRCGRVSVIVLNGGPLKGPRGPFKD